MKIKIFLFLIFHVLILSAQQTEIYSELINNIEPFETTTSEEKYKNGKIKEIKTLTSYKHNGEIYTFYTGTYTKFLRNGVKYEEREHDMFGVPLLVIWYYSNGDIYRKSETTKIDTNAKSIEEFLKSDKHIFRTASWEEFLPLNGKTENSELIKKGDKLNGKKIGIWKFYKKGKLVKEKKH